MTTAWRRYEVRLLLAILVLLLLLAGATPRFFSPASLSLLARSMGVLTILALGMQCVLITGGIDVSVGSMLAVTSVMLARIGNQGVSAAAGAIAAARARPVTAPSVARISPRQAEADRIRVDEPLAPLLPR